MIIPMTHEYIRAAQTVLCNGTRKPNRTGVDTISAFSVPMRHDLRDGFPLLTTKRMSWWNIVAENLWFISGERHVGFLRKHGIKFWDPWADEDGFVPSAYGNFWRHFPMPDLSSHEQVWVNGKDPGPKRQYNDQIAWVVNQLRTNPMSRRLVVSAWAPGNAQTSKLPPCHVMFCLNTQNLRIRGKSIADGMITDVEYEETDPRLCLHLTQRSCDMFLGVPYNIAGYAFILSLLAHLAGLKPALFSHMLVDAHFYTAKPDGTYAAGGTHGEDDDHLLDHVPLIKQQLTREPRLLPTFKIDPSIKELDDVTRLLGAPKNEILDVFRLEGYDPYPAIRGKAAV